MLSRNDQPNMDGFNFTVDSVFNSINVEKADSIPVIPNEFLLSDGSNFLLSDGTFFLLSE